MSLDPLLIIRFFRNECNEEERALVAAYLKDHPDELEHYLGEAEWMRFETTDTLLPGRSANMKQVVMNTIRTPAGTKRIRYRLLSVAAMLCVLLSASALLWRLYRPADKPSQRLAAADHNKMIIISNPSADPKQVRMPDGSLVIMEANSTLRYPETFRRNRTVWLNGSALFDVSRDEGHPFLVKTGVLQITVLGTRFQVAADKAGRDMRIKLFSGKIRIGIPDIKGENKKGTELLPGREFRYQQGTWTVRSFTHSKRDTPLPAAAAKEQLPLQSNALVFENQQLTTVLAALEARFKTPIHYKDKTIRHYYFSGEFTEADSLIQILNTICTLNGLKVKEDSTGYTLLPVAP